jgi:hypothetical protein
LEWLKADFHRFCELYIGEGEGGRERGGGRERERGRKGGRGRDGGYPAAELVEC